MERLTAKDQCQHSYTPVYKYGKRDYMVYPKYKLQGGNLLNHDTPEVFLILCKNIYKYLHFCHLPLHLVLCSFILY